MKAVKFSVAAATALALSTAALADGPVVYGKQNVEVGSFESGATVGGSEIGAKTHASRFGIKGTHDLGDGLTGLYQMELQHSLVGGVSNGGFGARNSFLGLSGGMGTVVVGNHDHPSKLALYKSGAGVFAPDSTAKLVQTEIRTSPAAAYVSPDFGGLTVAAALVLAGDNTQGVLAAYDDANATDDSDQMHFDIAAWGSAGPLKYGVGVIVPDTTQDVDPIIQASAGFTAGIMNAGLSVESNQDDMNLILQGNVKMDGGFYAGLGIEQFMADADNSDASTIGLIGGKKFADGKYDLYLAVKSHSDDTSTATVDNDYADIALGMTASF
jgi:predicted porin